MSKIPILTPLFTPEVYLIKHSRYPCEYGDARKFQNKSFSLYNNSKKKILTFWKTTTILLNNSLHLNLKSMQCYSDLISQKLKIWSPQLFTYLCENSKLCIHIAYDQIFVIIHDDIRDCWLTKIIPSPENPRDFIVPAIQPMLLYMIYSKNLPCVMIL